jgi:phosphatidate cytidylyltransferase
MSPQARDRLFGWQHAFDDPFTIAATAALAVVVVAVPIIVEVLARRGWFDDKLRSELRLRCWSWMALVPLMLVPILLGAAWTMLAVCVLSLLCYREFARATGLFRERVVSLVVTLGILAVTFTVFDNWYRLFVALPPFTIGILAMAAILRDQPQGYIQRVALGSLGFILFGSCFGHLGYLANDPRYRPWLILILVAVEMNDVFAYIVGKTLGKRQLCPNTSPKKTVAGGVGALVLTTALLMIAGPFAFDGTVLAHPGHLAVLGILVSVLGQFGDLVISSVKRDLGVKDMAAMIPGHGGLLDRFDSLILVAPAAFHYINYFVGVGADQPTRILTGG